MREKFLRWLAVQWNDVKGNAKWSLFTWLVAGGFAAVGIVIAAAWGMLHPTTLSGWISFAALLVGLLLASITVFGLVMTAVWGGQNASTKSRESEILSLMSEISKEVERIKTTISKNQPLDEMQKRLESAGASERAIEINERHRDSVRRISKEMAWGDMESLNHRLSALNQAVRQFNKTPTLQTALSALDAVEHVLKLSIQEIPKVLPDLLAEQPQELNRRKSEIAHTEIQQQVYEGEWLIKEIPPMPINMLRARYESWRDSAIRVIREHGTPDDEAEFLAKTSQLHASISNHLSRTDLNAPIYLSARLLSQIECLKQIEITIRKRLTASAA